MMTFAPSLRIALRLCASHALVGLIGVGAQTPATAASLHVDPVTFSLAGRETSAVLNISNADDKPVRIQVSVVRWRLGDDGVQSETPTDDVLLNPPVFQIDAHQTQFIRFGVRHPIASDTERAYRLIIEEVPEPDVAPLAGLRTVLRISVPVFIKPTEPRLHLSWTVESSNPGPLLSVVNDGNTHQRLLQLSIVAGDAHPTAVTDSPIYLLPHERRAWQMPANDSGHGIRTLKIQTEQGPQEEVIGAPADRP